MSTRDRLTDVAAVLLTSEAQKQMTKLPGGMIRRVNEVFERLEKWPDLSGAKPLRGELADSFRIRAGDWRILFRAMGDTVTVFAIDNRRDVYRS
jgi:mRNA-degrading endonuclease RelE of RelBE toxin-antitoxin system